MRFILASASPRRKELLEQIGVKFDILPATGEEVITKELPGEVVMELAKQKAEEVAKTAGADALVLGADTVVAYEGKILGKPKDEADALRMLTMLSGKEHEVYTGVALIDNRDQSMENFFERTKVTMYPVSEEEIRDYIAGGEPMDKAGAYAIQGLGAKFIQKIEGDYNNVVGLPIGRIYQEIKRKSIEIPTQFLIRYYGCEKNVLGESYLGGISGMNEYDEECLQVFLEKQLQLFQEEVATTPEEAEEFLSDCMAVICKDLKDVKDYFDEEGVDISGLSLDNLEELEEVFALPSGRYLIVEG